MEVPVVVILPLIQNDNLAGGGGGHGVGELGGGAVVNYFGNDSTL